MRMVLKAVGDVSGSKIGAIGYLIQRDGRADEGFAVLVGEQQHRLGDVPDLALDQAGLVVGDQGDDVSAGDVAVVHQGEAGGIEVEPDAAELAAWDRSANRAAEEHAGKVEIVGVPGLPGRLADPVLPGHALAHDVEHRWCLQAPDCHPDPERSEGKGAMTYLRLLPPRFAQDDK